MFRSIISQAMANPGPSDEKVLTDYPTNTLPKIPLRYFGS
jgi:hypothetical protein